MKTKGLVRAIALALALACPSACQADDQVQLTSLLDDCDTLSDSCGTTISPSLSCCDPALPKGYWFAGTEVTFLQVDANSGGEAFLGLNDTGTPGVDLLLLDANGLEDFAYAPRVWLGRQCTENWGVVGRYWYLEDTNVEPPTPFPGAVNGPNLLNLADTSRVRMYTIDAEAVRSFRPGRWKLDGTIGARHASIGVESLLSAAGTFTPGSFAQISLSDGFSFDGTGVTTAFTARRQISNWPAHFFLSGRASYLGGHTDSFARSVLSVAVQPNPPVIGSTTVIRTNGDSELDIFEFQTGIQFDLPLRTMPVNAFFRVAFEYQNWDVDGPLTGGGGPSGDVANVQALTFTSGGIGGAHLYGLALGTGFTW